LNCGTEWLAKNSGSIFACFGPDLAAEAENGFVYSMLDQTQGFNHAGVEQLSGGILTYVWAVLSAQSEECTPIIGPDMAFMAQKQFLANVEVAIVQSGDTSVDRYQDVQLW